MATRERMRLADSGVFMGSDLSDDSVDSTLSSRRHLATLAMDESSPPSTPAPAQTSRLPPSAEDLAVKAINQCLENGYESVDLSDLGLENLRNETLRPLHQLILHSHADLTEPPSEDEFGPLTPSIKLFLSGNKLFSLPSELFTLTNIAVLSLRNNELNAISSSIRRLSNLKELNIAQNNIKWLPWEMLDLMHCRGDHKIITVRPNPFINPIPDLHGKSPLPRPVVTPSEFKEHLSRWGETSGAFFQQMKKWYHEDGVGWTMRHELELRLKLGRLRLNNYLNEASRSGVELKLCSEQLLYVASSAVQYFEVDGSLRRTLTLSAPSTEEERLAAAIDPLEHQPAESVEMSRPSLFELSLRAVRASYFTNDLLDYAQDLPESVVSGLKKAAAGAEYGDESCSICGNQFIIARAEWVEYWFNGFPSQDYLTPELIVPFMRRVCSWKCARPSDLGAFRL